METRAQYVQRKRRGYEALRRLAEAADSVRIGVRKLDNSKAAKAVAGSVAEVPGFMWGVGRGAIHDVKAVKDGATFAWDLANPWSAHHDEAVATGRNVLGASANYIASRAAEPSLIRRDVGKLRANLNRDLNPEATAVAPTLHGEFDRRFAIGANQGEVGWNVASLALPIAGELKGAAELGRFAPPGAAKYIEMGATSGEAARFAKPYTGVGHHAFIPRKATWEKVPGVRKAAGVLGVPLETLQGKVPDWVVDSPFNVVKPKVETGQLYRRHVGIDKDYGGGRVGREFGGTNWKGSAFGWEKYRPFKRFWYGTPAPTKAVGLGGLTALDGLGLATDAGDKRRR